MEIPVDQIRVTTRLRSTDDSKIQDLAESIAGVGLLHPITVSQNGDQYHLLAGNHRLEAHRLLGRKTIPATVNDADPLVEELIEIEENLISNRLSPIQEANHIVRWEEILSQLGRRAVTGDNRWNRTGLTNADLAKSRGMAKSTYLMTKTIAKINPEVQDIIEVSEYDFNKTDLVKLVKESDEVQLEVANLIATGECSTFKRALTLARCKVLAFDWGDEQKRIKELVGMPKSVMKFDGEESHLARLCKLVSNSEDCRVNKKTWGTSECPNYSQHPDHSAYFINYYSNEGDTVVDVMSGRGTNLLVAAALGRKVVGYDLSPQNLEAVRSACLQHTEIEPTDLVLHHSDGVALNEYDGQEEIWDLVTFDPPYIFNAENYESQDPRDLCLIKDLETFNTKIEQCLTNLKRLIKRSDWEKKEFHPIVVKCNYQRRGKEGITDMATEIEIIGRKLNLSLHDKVVNVLNSQWAMFNVSRCVDNRYSVKVHETCLVFVKY